MPPSPPREATADTVRDLGLPTRTVSALTRAGVTRTEQLAALTRRELAAIDGIGPGAIAAIRTVVPEPPGRLAGPGSRPAPLPGMPGGPDADEGPSDPAEDDGPASPAIPSFASLRGSWRPAVDALVGGPAPAPPAEERRAGEPDPQEPGPQQPGPREPRVQGPGPREPRPQASRPPEYADLVVLGVRLVQVAATVPVRLVRWSVCAPVRWLGARR
ncbi:hypothetical protein ACI8AC_21055 [Geodermatophilus sp. SYSU D00758]